MITLAAFATVLLGSCSKINERIDNLEKKVDGLENEKIASIENQITGINSSISDLGAIRSNIQSLTDEAKSQGQDITDLQAADKALGSRIGELTKYVGDTLKAYATEEWARATFSTLGQYEKTCDTIAKIDARIGFLDAKLSKDIKTCADSLTKWVNKTFEGYYTAAQMDAKLALMKSAVDSARAANLITDAKVDSLAVELAKVQPAIDSAKATITAEYTAAINTAITALDGKLTKQIQDEIEKVNGTVTDLSERVGKLEFQVKDLLGRVGALESRVQSVTIVPAYSDGSVKVENDSLFLDCIITPATATRWLGWGNFTILVKGVAGTKAGVETIGIAPWDLAIDSRRGTASIKVKIADKLPGNDSTLAVAVNVKDTRNGSDYTTEFVPVYAVTVAPKGFVDLGVIVNSKPLYWAEKNLGASKPEEYGKYYSWGDVTGQTPSGSTFSKSFSWDNDVFGESFNKVEQTTACPDGVLAQTYDAAYQTNNAWRMPTREDFSELAKQCFLEWTDNYNSTGVKGVIVWKAKGDDAGWFKPSTPGKGLKIKDDGSSYNTKVDHTFSNTYAIGTDPCVFFPAAGYGDGTSLYNANTSGSYWSGSLFSLEPTNARLLFFGVSNVNLLGFDYRCNCSPVRPVKD